MNNLTEPQYFINIQKGFTVSYGNKPYRVQDDGRGYLHIIVFENGQRKKIGIDKLKETAFEPGTKADWVFNGWSLVYNYEQYKAFATAEVAWLNN